MQEAVIEVKDGEFQNIEINQIVRSLFIVLLERQAAKICKDAVIGLIFFELVQCIPSLTAGIFLILAKNGMITFFDEPVLYICAVTLTLILSGFAVLNFFRYGYTANWLKAGVMGMYYLVLVVAGLALGMEENSFIMTGLYLMMTILACVSILIMNSIRNRLLDIRDFSDRIRKKTEEILKEEMCPMEIEITGIGNKPYNISVSNIQNLYDENKIVIHYQENKQESPE